MNQYRRLLSVLCAGGLGLGALACSDDDSGDAPGADGTGSVDFTIWGEEFIQDEIPADEVEDGWAIAFDRFLIVVADVSVADEDAGMGGRLDTPQLFDLAEPGPVGVGMLTEVGARSWNDVGYSVLPAGASTTVAAGAGEEDLTFMRSEGYSVFAEGTATKGDVTKTFAWGFRNGTRYDGCVQVDDTGADLRAGIVVGNGAVERVQLTIHGDHFFFDSLGEDAQLRFDAIANADSNDDGEVTLEELAAVRLVDIDVGTDEPRYVGNQENLREFIEALTQNLGHFRGEGHCSPQTL